MGIDSATAGTMRILGMLMTPQTSKVGIRVAVNTVAVTWVKDQALCLSSFQIATNTIKSRLMGMFLFETVMGALMDSKGNTRRL